MNYDFYGDIVVTSKLNLELTPLLKRYRKIYHRGAFSGPYRTLALRWISPFEEKPFDTRFLSSESNYKFYGDLSLSYYSPRYANQRLRIKELVGKGDYDSLTVVGSGISTFSIYCEPYFKRVTEYEINPEARRYGYINKVLNKCDLKKFEQKEEYDTGCAAESQVVLSIIPSEPLDFHLKYKFSKILVFYLNLQKADLEKIISRVKQNYNPCTVKICEARKYSVLSGIYRVMVVKDASVYF